MLQWCIVAMCFTLQSRVITGCVTCCNCSYSLSRIPLRDNLNENVQRDTGHLSHRLTILETGFVQQRFGWSHVERGLGRASWLPMVNNGKPKC